MHCNLRLLDVAPLLGFNYEAHNVAASKFNNAAGNIFSNRCAFISVLAKFVLRMLRHCYL